MLSSHPAFATPPISSLRWLTLSPRPAGDFSAPPSQQQLGDDFIAPCSGPGKVVKGLTWVKVPSGSSVPPPTPGQFLLHHWWSWRRWRRLSPLVQTASALESHLPFRCPRSRCRTHPSWSVPRQTFSARWYQRPFSCGYLMPFTVWRIQASGPPGRSSPAILCGRVWLPRWLPGVLTPTVPAG